MRLRPASQSGSARYSKLELRLRIIPANQPRFLLETAMILFLDEDRAYLSWVAHHRQGFIWTASVSQG
jgi:hypothetical protein